VNAIMWIHVAGGLVALAFAPVARMLHWLLRVRFSGVVARLKLRNRAPPAPSTSTPRPVELGLLG
jgi:hypothetical protein